MYTKTTFLAFALVLTLVFPVLAQEMPPEGGAPKDFSIPEKIEFELDNGLQATLVPYGSLPKVTVRVNLRTGNIDEEADEVWLADIMGDLMGEGTTTRAASEVAEAAARMGGSVNVGVGLDQSNVTGDVLSEFGPDLVALLADVLRNPALPESELDRLKRDRVRQLSIQSSQPGSIAMARFREEMYRDHAYGRIYPTEEMLNGYTIDDVKAFYEANIGAARTHVYVAGRFDVRVMEQAIRDAFGDWQRGSDPVMMPAAPQSERAVHIVDMPGAAQSNVYIGLPVVDPSHEDYMTLQVMNSLLGGSFASRITSNIREDKGYTYSPFSQVSARYRDAYWAQVAAITTSVTGPAIEEIFKEVDLLRTEAPSAEELEGIQNYMAGTFVLQNSSRGGIIGQLAYLNLHGLSDAYLTNYVENIYAVTPEEVQRIADTYLRSDEMMIVIAGDQAQIESQVSKFGRVVN